MPVAELHFVEAYRAHNLAQAHVIGLALEEEGHRVLIENESDVGYPPGWRSDPRLMVEKSDLAAAYEIIGRIDHGPKSKVGSMLGAKFGLLFLLLFVGFSAHSLSAVVCSLLATIIWLFACVRMRRRETTNQNGTTRCLTCHATMSETETVCPSCGWTYGSGLPPESP